MTVAAVLAVVAVAGPALARGKRGGEYHDLRRDHMIKKFDQDSDGRLSRAIPPARREPSSARAPPPSAARRVHSRQAFIKLDPGCGPRREGRNQDMLMQGVGAIAVGAHAVEGGDAHGTGEVAV